MSWAAQHGAGAGRTLATSSRALLRGVLLARCLDTCQDPESQKNERSDHDPMDWRMKDGGSENQSTDDDDDPRNVDSEGHGRGGSLHELGRAWVFRIFPQSAVARLFQLATRLPAVRIVQRRSSPCTGSRQRPSERYLPARALMSRISSTGFS